MGEKERKGKVKAREGESRWREGFGHQKILAWRQLGQTYRWF